MHHRGCASRWRCRESRRSWWPLYEPRFKSLPLENGLFVLRQQNPHSQNPHRVLVCCHLGLALRVGSRVLIALLPLVLLIFVDFRISILGATPAAGAVVSQGPQGGHPELLDDFGGHCTSLISNLFLLRIGLFVLRHKKNKILVVLVCCRVPFVVPWDGP